MPHHPIVLACRPPATELTTVDDCYALPPGYLAILVADDGPGAGVDPRLAAFRTGAPWVPLCVMPAVSAPLMQAALWAGSPPVIPSPIPASTLVRRAVEVIRGRPIPTIEDLASWIAHRLDRPVWLATLTEAMTPPARTESLATDGALRRRLRRLSTLGRHDWRRLAVLAALPRHRLGVEALALEAGVNAGPFRRWTSRLLGLAASAYRQLPGWEPVLELGLRRAGLVEGERSESEGQSGTAQSGPLRPAAASRASPAHSVCPAGDARMFADAGPRHGA